MTDVWDRLRSTTSSMLMTEFAVERGVPRQHLLRGTGISPEALLDPWAEVTAGQELLLLRNIVAELGDSPGLGLLAGQRYHLSTHGVYGFAIACSPNIRGAIEVATRFVELAFTLCHVSLHDEGDRLVAVLDDSAVPEDVRRLSLERDFATVTNVQRDLIPFRLPGIQISIPFDRETVYDAFVSQVSDVPPVYNAPQAAFSVEAALWSLPIPQGNVHTGRLYEQQCIELMQRRSNRGGVGKQVRQLLVRSGGIAAQADVAAELSMSVRTLRRRLADEGTTFREVSDETFGLLAEELLSAGMTVEQVAYRLGYSSASAFANAFRSWKGQTPGRFARDRRRVRTGV
ncbi:MAG: AraC family transcriptional regulator [Mycobacteriaceae bacterium]|nr:AraC family transcriptional regulator [Mycobacteriaceae bacterium]